jgi:hypothetical protein
MEDGGSVVLLLDFHLVGTFLKHLILRNGGSTLEGQFCMAAPYLIPSVNSSFRATQSGLSLSIGMLAQFLCDYI